VKEQFSLWPRRMLSLYVMGTVPDFPAANSSQAKRNTSSLTSPSLSAASRSVFTSNRVSNTS